MGQRSDDGAPTWVHCPVCEARNLRVNLEERGCSDCLHGHPAKELLSRIALLEAEEQELHATLLTTAEDFQQNQRELKQLREEVYCAACG